MKNMYRKINLVYSNSMHSNLIAIQSITHHSCTCLFVISHYGNIVLMQKFKRLNTYSIGLYLANLHIPLADFVVCCNRSPVYH